MRRCPAKCPTVLLLLPAFWLTAGLGACTDPGRVAGAIEERSPTVDGGHRGFQDARWADAGAPAPGGSTVDDESYLLRPLPVLMFDTGGKTIERNVEIPGRLKVIENPDPSLAEIAARPVTLDTPVVI